MRILLITDSHLAAAATPFIANWKAAAAWAERSSIDLTIHLGDITLDAVNADLQIDEAKALIDAWPTPIRLIPGNHDVGDNVDSVGVPRHEWISDARLARYRGVFGDDWWSDDVGDWRLIALDAQLLGSGLADEDRQWAWLRQEVDALGGRPVILLVHKPLFEYPDRDADHSPRYLSIGSRDRLLAAFGGVDLRMAVCGHTHQHLDRDFDGVRHVWLPSCAFVIPDPHQRRTGEKIVGFGLLEIDGDDYRLDVIGAEGLGRHDITKFPKLAKP